MRHGSLFSGIGGFDLAASWMGWENVFQVENDKFCTKVLEKNFPNTKRYGDIKEFDGKQYRGAIDILTGGFPCQPFSLSGLQKGKDDVRYLWPEMLRVIGEIKPDFIVGENVGGSWGMVDEICANLEHIGYSTQPISIEAASLGADHKRGRFWFMANTNTIGSQRQQFGVSEDQGNGTILSPIFPTVSFQSERTKDYLPKPYNVGGIDGIPNRMDRIKGLGNAIVPQIAYEIFKAIALVATPER